MPEQVPSYFWTDSTAALHWIRNDQPWKQYIEHRVTEICQLTDCQQWRHCPGNLNPADIPSRGMNGAKLSKSELWWKGPTFLFQPQNQCPDVKSIPSNDITDAELTKKPTLSTHILVTFQSCEDPPLLDNIIDCSKYSKWDKVLSVTAYALRFVSALRRRSKEQRSRCTTCNSTNHLTVEEIDNAERMWILHLQARLFQAETTFLKASNRQSPPIQVHQFGLFLDPNGILRCRGRVNNSTLEQNAKNPILLPNNHHWVNCL